MAVTSAPVSSLQRTLVPLMSTSALAGLSTVVSDTIPMNRSSSQGWGAVRFLVVGSIGQEERPPRGQLWMEQCLTLLKYWPI